MSLSLLLLTLISHPTISDDTYCTTNDEYGNCLECEVSILQPDGTCRVPQNPIENCLIYLEDESCFKCVYGYKLVDRSCTKIDDSDMCIFGTNDSCYLCRRKQALVFHYARPSHWFCSETAKCENPHSDYCRIYERKEEAIFCESGYVANFKGECQKVTQRTQNCKTANAKICFECMPNYYIQYGSCVKSPDYYFDLDWMHKLQTEERVM